jgi:hypothetical protein
MKDLPAAKISPSGSNAATGLPDKCMSPWQFGDLMSQSLKVLSNEPERNWSSVGAIDNVTTFFVCPGKYLK